MNLRRRHRRKGQQQFVVLTAGRSGSTLLLDMLRSHPDVVVRRTELLNRDIDDSDPRLLTYRNEAVVRRAAAHAASTGRSTWGWALHPDQMKIQKIDDPTAWCRQLHRDGARFITLQRDDHVASGLSAALASATNTWHIVGEGGSVPPPVHVDPLAVLQQVKRFEEGDADVGRIIGDLSHIELHYETDLADAAEHQATADRVFAYLGLPSHTVTTAIRRPSRPLSQRVQNLSELVETFEELGLTIAARP